jgi:Rrf2 family protein
MLGRTALHTIKALTALARTADGEYAGAATLAMSVGAPGNYLGKLLQSLARAGVVEGRKGLNGGFRLARPADQISLYDIVEPLEHVSKWDGCFMTHKSCDRRGPCAVHQRWATVREAYTRFLKETSVRDLMDVPSSLEQVSRGELLRTSAAGGTSGRRRR